MTENTQGYGFAEVTTGESLKFGLNAGIATLKKFEWTPNGGKDGAAQEALDILFDVGGREISYRKFPVAKAFYKEEGSSQQLETTDPAHPAMAEARNTLSAVLVHIVGCFVEKQAIRDALALPIKNFKEYCMILSGLLPSNYPTKKLDIFCNWQWQIRGESDKTFLELPKNMKHGRWLSPAIAPAGGVWEKQDRSSTASDNEVALRYVDKEGNVHPFTRTGWFMNSNFAKQQKEEETATDMSNTESSGSGW